MKGLVYAMCHSYLNVIESIAFLRYNERVGLCGLESVKIEEIEFMGSTLCREYHEGWLRSGEMLREMARCCHICRGVQVAVNGSDSWS